MRNLVVCCDGTWQAVADEEPESVDVLAEAHDEVAGLLRGPRPVGMRGHAEDVPYLDDHDRRARRQARGAATEIGLGLLLDL